MSDLIRREDAINALVEKGQSSKRYKIGDFWELNLSEIKEALDDIPSAEPEMLTIEEVSNQLGCATIQTALYWFEFLKTLDLLGFAIVRKETR